MLDNLYINKKVKLNIPAGFIFKDKIDDLFSVVDVYKWKNKPFYLFRNSDGKEIQISKDDIKNLYDKGYIQEKKIMFRKKILKETIPELKLTKGQIIYIQEEEDPAILDKEAEINDLENELIDAKKDDDKHDMESIKQDIDDAKEDLADLKDRAKE